MKKPPLSTHRRRDPHAAREAAKYANPLPSREYILTLIQEHETPLDCEALAAVLGIEDEQEREALTRRVKAMLRDGQVIENRRGQLLPVNAQDLVSGRVIGHPDGFGFLVPDSGGDDVFLSPRQMRALMPGDRCVVRVVGVDRRGRNEGALVEVLARNTRHVVGRFFREGGVGFVAPDNKRIVHEIVVPQGGEGGAQHGQIVSVEITEQPSAHSQPVGRVIELLGDHMAPGMEIDIAIRAHDLPNVWPQAVLDEVAPLGKEVPESARQGREDLRTLPLVTIDGEDARDFDDAVHCTRTPKGFRLIVAIADVGHYVQPGSALDGEARTRGTSVYFPERVIPMLPEALSNGLCSLNPDVDRLCLACELTVSAEGEPLRSRFFEGVMRSQARLTYGQAAAMLVDRDDALRRRYAPVIESLDALYDLYHAFDRARRARGAIEFESTETRFIFDAARKIERIEPVVRNDAHKLIEECMVAANVAAARFLLRHKLPALYRVHPGVKPDKLEDLRAFLGEFGLRLGGGPKPAAGDYAKLLEKARARPDAHLIETVLLRSLSQAVYSPDNIGHFGLAHEAYTHFTSPIRRYPDLVVHRAIRHCLRHGKADELDTTYADLVLHGEHSSACERRADEATRDAVAWLKCEFMMDKLGEHFQGTVSAVTSFGLFVELDGIYVEGLVHISTLPGDYYHYDPVAHRLRGERSGRGFRLGDRLEVIVSRVDLDERKLDLMLAGAKDEPRAAPRGGRRRGRR